MAVWVIDRRDAVYHPCSVIDQSSQVKSSPELNTNVNSEILDGVARLKSGQCERTPPSEQPAATWRRSLDADRLLRNRQQWQYLGETRLGK